MLIISIVFIFLGISSSSSSKLTSNELNHAVDEDAAVVLTVEDVLDKLQEFKAELNEVKEENLQYRTRLSQLGTRLDKVVEENSQYQTTVKNLQEKIEYLEITRKEVPRTCHDIKNLGYSRSGKYLIDPDGSGHGDPPITVNCDLSGALGVTEVEHNAMDVAEVVHCGQPGCDVHSISYAGSDKQMKTLKDLSEHCSQSVAYSCLSSPLRLANQSMAWWVGSNGVRHHYWDGKHSPTEHRCACAASGSCGGNSGTCHCDQNLYRWSSDEGTLKDQVALPVKQMNFGGPAKHKSRGEAKVKLGPFSCTGRKPMKVTESCRTLFQAGNTASGYYLVDGPGGVNYDLVQCNMHLDPSNPEFQVATQLKMAEYPVAFHFVLTKSPSTYFGTTGVIPYTESRTNDGNGMTMDGIFTSPLSGIYELAFTTTECVNWGNTWVQIRVDKVPVTNLFLQTNRDLKNSTTIREIHDSIPGSISAIVSLRKGQIVDTYLKAGSICNDVDPMTHFTGHLLYPTN